MLWRFAQNMPNAPAFVDMAPPKKEPVSIFLFSNFLQFSGLLKLVPQFGLHRIDPANPCAKK